MRILFITRKYPPKIGGMESFSAGLYNHLKTGKKLIALKKGKFHLVWFIPYAFFQALFTNYDLLYFTDGALAFLGIILKKIKHKPIAITVHGLDLTCEKKWYRWLNVKRLGNFDRIISVSQNTKEICLKKGVKEEKIVVIPNGIEKVDSIPKFPKEKKILENKLGINLEGKKVLLTVGRLIKRKGVFWFTRSVVSKLDKSLIYCIVGDGPEKDEICKTIMQFKLDHKVFILDNVDNSELEKIYREADLFVMPNISIKNDVEGFGIVAAEAASRGLPVVASNIEGIRDVVTERIGLRIKEKDVDGFANSINKLASNDQILRRKSVESFREANEKFNWQIVACRYEDNFASAIARSEATKQSRQKEQK